MLITLTTTTDVLIVALALKPLFEQTEEVREDARIAGKELLNHSQKIEDYTDRAKLIGFVYIIAQIMEIKELLDDEIIKTFPIDEGENKELFTSKGFEPIRDMALFDQDYYMKWIAPFIKNAGVLNIDEALEELRVIEKTVYG